MIPMVISILDRERPLLALTLINSQECTHNNRATSVQLKVATLRQSAMKLTIMHPTPADSSLPSNSKEPHLLHLQDSRSPTISMEPVGLTRARTAARQVQAISFLFPMAVNGCRGPQGLMLSLICHLK